MERAAHGMNQLPELFVSLKVLQFFTEDSRATDNSDLPKRHRISYVVFASVLFYIQGKNDVRYSTTIVLTGPAH